MRHVLQSIRVPTLLLHAANDAASDVRHSRYMAERIPGAKLVVLPGADHLPWLADADTVIEEIAESLTGMRPVVEPDRVLATVLFTDSSARRTGPRCSGTGAGTICSTATTPWSARPSRAFAAERSTAAATASPPRSMARLARSSARTDVDGVHALGLAVRCGIHTGECEVMGDDFGGIAVHIGASIAALADAGEILVSSTVKDLVAGSGLRFADRGARSLKGVPDEWRVFSVER